MSMTKDFIIESGVKSLRRFGYPACNERNIFTDEIYRQFFAGWLRDNKGQGAGEHVDKILDELITECTKPVEEVKLGKPKLKAKLLPKKVRK